ncbi:hypothetical protein [Uliginosibacterium gangwonense]|uniref:hypothetical protein n=1 Tax=Uliginosibacterium gangwonense TaxID=392736 RepID=UPI000379FD4D|nr:hypothetical protein [Uliginosibacterium gangwonense]
MMVLQCLAAVLVASRTYWYVALPLLIVAIVFVLGVAAVMPSRVATLLRGIPSVLVIGFFANQFAGHFASNWLLATSGIAGSATVVSIESTSSMYNDQPVMRHQVMIRPQQGGAVIQTYFDTSDFNITPQPTEGGYVYPQQGSRFNVRYLPDFPRAVVVLSDDDSPYSRSLRCQHSMEVQNKLSNQLAFDPQNGEFKAALANAKHVAEQDCRDPDVPATETPIP